MPHPQFVQVGTSGHTLIGNLLGFLVQYHYQKNQLAIDADVMHPGAEINYYLAKVNNFFLLGTMRMFGLP